MTKTRLEIIIEKFKEMFMELTAMNPITDWPEEFRVHYSPETPFSDPLCISKDSDFSPVFCRKLEDGTLFAETHVSFMEHPDGTFGICFSASFSTEDDEGTWNKESDILYPEWLEKLAHLEADATDDDFLNFFRKFISDSAQDMPAYFMAKTIDELIKAVTPKRTAPDPDYPEDFDAIPF